MRKQNNETRWSVLSLAIIAVTILFLFNLNKPKQTQQTDDFLAPATVTVKQKHESKKNDVKISNLPSTQQVQSNHQLNSTRQVASIVPSVLKNESSALAYAHKLKDELGFKTVDIETDAEYLKITTHPLSLNYSFKQVHQGYEVYGANLRLFGRKSDGALYYYNHQLKNIQTSQLNINYPTDSAQEKVESTYQRKTMKLEKVADQPLVFVDTSGKAELAWRFVINIESPLPDRREVLVSALTGEILQDLSYKILN
jgi:hypothetical protein